MNMEIPKPANIATMAVPIAISMIVRAPEHRNKANNATKNAAPIASLIALVRARGKRAAIINIATRRAAIVIDDRSFFTGASGNVFIGKC